jgi:hypothetical protein
MRKPHPEGLLGAIRVEVRGTKDGARKSVVLGCHERPAATAAAVASYAAATALGGGLGSGVKGIAGVAEHPTDWLQGLYSLGVRISAFEGS